MSDEIKEISYLQEYIDKYKYDEKSIINGNRLTTPAMLDYIETKEILDYITNLQEENKRLKELLQQEKKDFKETNDYCFELLDYKSRNEEAVELINKYSKYPTYYLTGNIVKELLNILTGGDKE